jgi:hypothetical protein
LKEGILGKFAINVKWKCYIIMDENWLINNNGDFGKGREVRGRKWHLWENVNVDKWTNWPGRSAAD